MTVLRFPTSIRPLLLPDVYKRQRYYNWLTWRGVTTNTRKRHYKVDRQGTIGPDVYKRQVPGRGLVVEVANPPAVNGTMAPLMTVVAVSYTHLDVYKRQMRTRPTASAIYCSPQSVSAPP